jgi:hypothetical protein
MSEYDIDVRTNKDIKSAGAKPGSGLKRPSGEE